MEFDDEKTAVIDHLNYDVKDQGKVNIQPNVGYNVMVKRQLS